ncbi:MAG: hypothetical protein QUS33_03950 [Dehalococcoidia bacterium]|nr:hypothetical protein [Dehalococcoidia bacterium]
MNSDKIGILELKNDPFAIDLASKLTDLPVDFLSFTDGPVPVSTNYRVVVDRISFRYTYLKEMVKNMSLDGTYVINNPFAAAVNSKLVEAKVCQALEIPYPKSVVLPDPALQGEAPAFVVEPDWERIADEVGFPCIMKPVYGYAWVDVYELNTLAELKACYAAGAGRIWLVQRKVRYDRYYRVFCIDKKDVLFVRWIPRPLGMGEYLHTDPWDTPTNRARVAEKIVRLNSCLDMDVNVVEWCVDNNGQEWVIDALNEVPDMPKERMPPEHYWWIVDRFVACVRDRMQGDHRNKAVFEMPAAQGIARGGGVQVS